MPHADSELGSDPAGRFVEAFIERYGDEPDADVRGFLEHVPEEFRVEVRRRLQAYAQLQSVFTLPEVPLNSEGVVVPGPLGDFRPRSVLGRGGMGTVYLADQVSLGREVALKVLAPQFGGSARRKERFRREALAVAKLRHPNIVQVLAYGEENDAHYLAMEYVEGESLADVIRSMRDAGPERESAILSELGTNEFHESAASGRLPTSRSRVVVAAGIALRVCEALVFAHDRGIIHRDVKPSNILLRDGVPLLVDFGLSKDLEDSALSLSGDVIGTPYYMSPEQARRKEVDARTDIYSLGVTMYELVTGKLPFEGEGLAQVLHRLQTKEVTSPRKIRSDVPLDLETIILKCMEKNPDRRYSSSSALAADLLSFLELRPISARPVGAATRAIRRMRQQPARFLALALLLVVVLAAPVIWTLRESARHQQERADLATRQRNGLRLLTESTTALERSPGLALVLAVEGAKRVSGLNANNVLYEAWRASLGPGRELETLVGHEALVRQVEFSPDGTRVVSSSKDATVRIWGVPDGKLLCTLEGHLSEVGGFRFSDDGRELITVSSDFTARVWDVESGDCTRILLGHDAPVSFADFVADGDQVVTASLDGTIRLWQGEVATVLDRNMVRYEYSRFTDCWGFAPRQVSLDETRTYLAFAGYNAEVRIINLLTGEKQIIQCAEANRPRRVNISGAGRFVSVVGPSDVSTWTLVGEPLGYLDLPVNATDAVPSPQGDVIAICDRAAASTGVTEVRLMSTDLTQTIQRFSTSSEVGPLDVVFSPSGRYLAAVDPSSKCIVWDVESGDVVAVLMGHETQVLCASFSPDENYMVTGAEDSDVRLWQLTQDEFIHRYPVGRAKVDQIAISSDGKTLVSCSSQREIRVVDVETGALIHAERFRTPAHDARFFDDRLLVVSSTRAKLLSPAGFETLWEMSSPQKNWTFAAMDVHPDGSRILAGGRSVLDGWAMVFDANTREHAFNLQGHVKAVRSACYSPDGETALTGSLDGTAKIWDARTGQLLKTFSHGVDVRHASFSNDGSRVVTGSWDRNVRVWDVESEELLVTLAAHSHSVESAHFSPDDRYIVTGSLDGTVRVWEGDHCIAVLDHKGWVMCAKFGPDGREIYVGTGEGVVYRWPFPPLEAAQSRRPRMPTAREQRRFTSEGNDPVPATYPNLAQLLYDAWGVVHVAGGTDTEYQNALQKVMEAKKVLSGLNEASVDDLHGAALIRCGRFREGLDWLQRARDRESEINGATGLLVLSFTIIGLVHEGDVEEARRSFEQLQGAYEQVVWPRFEIDLQQLYAEARSAVQK